MKWGIIATIMVGLVIAGVLGTMMSHADAADVQTNVSVLTDKKVPVENVIQGDTVYIGIKVVNNGDSAYPLSSHAPVFAYAKIYKLNLGGKQLVDTVKFETKYVMYHVVNLQPHSNYTTALQWTVPSNVTGFVEIDAWAGSAPVGTTTVDVTGIQSSNDHNNEYVVMDTDALAYYPGQTVYITLTNYGDEQAIFGAGFKVMNDTGNVVTDKTQRHLVELQPGESIEYSWTIPSDMESGWYYIYNYANDDYTMIYIL